MGVWAKTTTADTWQINVKLNENRTRHGQESWKQQEVTPEKT